MVCGATGRVGSLVVRHLLELGIEVRAVGRRGPKLEALEALGARRCAGSLTDPAFLADAFAGARAAFVMTPVDTSAADVNGLQDAVIDASVSAVARSAIEHVVLLSSWGAELTEPVGGIIACHRFEQALAAMGRNVISLRPVWFLDNFLWSIPLVQMAGFNGSPVDGRVRFPMIAARDIAPVAAEYLSSLEFSGWSVRYLQGAADYTLTEVTKALGSAIGKPELPYVAMPEAAYRRGLLGAGLTADAAQLALEITRAIEAGVVQAPPRSPASTTPTTIEQFAAEVFAPAYHRSPPPKLGERLGGLALRTYLRVSGHRAA